VLAKHPDRVDMGVLAQFPEYLEFRSGSRRPTRKEPRGHPTPEEPTQHLSPTEAITEMVDEAHSTVAGDLLARILLRPPQFLERLVLKLLVSMGYGGLEAVTEHLGGPGDQGLDGLIRQDLLGLDVVYVQAKRYATDHKVGRPDIQGFVGALHGAQASRGIFITTSSFSAEARRYADRVSARVVLIDGPELAQLMVEHNCGVRVEETFVLKEVDEDFFDET
jgi:restriction system protein